MQTPFPPPPFGVEEERDRHEMEEEKADRFRFRRGRETRHGIGMGNVKLQNSGNFLPQRFEKYPEQCNCSFLYFFIHFQLFFPFSPCFAGVQ